MSALTDPTDTTHRHVLPTTGGGQIRFYTCHGRVEVTTQSANGRHRSTTPRTVAEMRHTIQRLEDLCFLAESGANGADPQQGIDEYRLDGDGFVLPRGFGISVREAPENHVCITVHNPGGNGERWHFFVPSEGGKHLGKLLIEQSNNVAIKAAAQLADAERGAA